MSILQGKVAIVTGASRGIGEAIALAFGSEGADVACTATTAHNAAHTAERIEAMGRRAIAVGTRVEDGAQIAALFEQVAAELGPVDILVNNVGIAAPKPVLEMTEEEWDYQLAVNLKSAFLCSQAAARQMQAAGKGGNIINIGSITGQNAFPNRVGYCASKAAMHHMTRVMAIEWAPLDIRVNCIAPGYIFTDIFRNLVKQGIIDQPALEGRIPQRKLGDPEDIGRAAVYLAGNDAKYVTGSVLNVDGGWDAYGYI